MLFLKNMYYQLVNSKYLNNLFVLTSGVGMSQLIPLLLLPVLTRFFSPLDFGLFALFMAIVQLLAITTTFRLEMAVVLPKKDTDAVLLCLMSFCLLLFFSILFLLGLLICSEYIKGMTYSTLELTHLMICLVPIAFFLLGVYNILYSWNNRLELYKNMSYSHITHSMISTPMSILFYFTSFKGIGLILGQIIGRVVACLFLLMNIVKTIRSLNKVHIINQSIVLLKKYKKFVLFETPHSILNFLSQKYIIGFFSTFFGLSTVGVFDLADKILGKPLGVISNAFKTVFYKRLTTAKDKINLFRRSIILMTFISFLLTFPFYVLPDTFFVFLLGSEWSDTGKYIQLICPLLFSRFIFNVVAPSLSYTLQNDYLLIWQIIYFIILVFLFWFFRNLDVESVLFIYAIFGAFMYIVLGCISFMVLKKYIKN